MPSSSWYEHNSVKTAAERARVLISCFSSAYCWVRNAVTVDTGQDSAGDPMLVWAPGHA